MSRNAEERRGGAGVERRAAADRDGVYDLDRDSSERLIFRPLDEKATVWAPDGHSTYYRSDGAGGPPNVFRWTSEAEGGKVYYRGAGVQEPQDVSPDGKWLLFVNARQAGAGDINVLPLTPSGPAQPFVVTHFDELSPRGRLPRWSADGKVLFYLAPGGRLMAVPITAGVSTAAPHMLFQATDAVDFEPAGDGSRFVVQLEQRSGEPPGHLLINWLSRLVSP